MRQAARKLIVLVGGLAAVLLVVALPSWGQEALEPSGELATAECYGHHKQEGFRSMDLFPAVLREVPRGQEFQFDLKIRNPWLHELLDLNAYVNITNAPGLSFPGERDPEPFDFSEAVSSQPGAPGVRTHDIPVEANATELVVVLVGDPGATEVDRRLNKNDYDLVLQSPDGATTVVDPADKDTSANPREAATPVETVRVDQTNLTQAGPGTWRATVTYHGVTAPQGSYELHATVYYNLSRSSELILKGPAKLDPGQEHTFTFTIVAKDVAALQQMRYGGRGTAHHEHTDKAIGDFGDYDKWNTLEFQTGATLSVGDAVAPTTSVDLLGPVFRRWGQVLGFASSFLVLPSLVFGGTFGRGSVEALNRWFGGARRRVLFHNSMSFMLLGLSVLHMLIFFYEAFWSWSHGLVWGGLSLACMIGLGVTGATQRSFVAKWGFTRWRFVHFAMGVLVFVFVLVHVVADGSHFAPIQNMFG